MKFTAKVDVVESMGSELYVYFDVQTQQEVQSDDLAELAKDAGLEDLPEGAAAASTWWRASTRRAGRRPAARSSSRSRPTRSSCSTPTAGAA